MVWWSQVSVQEAENTVKLWYKERQEVLIWQEERKKEAIENRCVHTLLGRARQFPAVSRDKRALRGHIERAAINTPVQVLSEHFLSFLPTTHLLFPRFPSSFLSSLCSHVRFWLCDCNRAVLLMLPCVLC